MKINAETKGFFLQTPFSGEVDAHLKLSSYSTNENLAILLCYYYKEDDGEIYEEKIPITVNIVELPKNMAALDKNNLENYEYWEQIKLLIASNELGVMRGEVPSGYCMYPVFEFDMEKLKSLSLSI